VAVAWSSTVPTTCETRTYARAGKGGPPSSWAALVDTGASITSLSTTVIRNLSPQPLETAIIYRPNAEAKQILIYDVELKFDGHLSPGRWFEMEVVEAQPATPGIEILLGMDLLKQLHLYLSGPDGKLVLSY
jgi:predicted aspartyl protease